MVNPNYNIEHKKGQHLIDEEHGIIQAYLRDGWNPNRIAKDLNRPYSTIKNKVKRGTVLLYDGKVERYKAEVGAEVYREYRKNRVKRYKRLKVSPVIGTSIEERPKAIEIREEFGHLEMDSVFGCKNADEPVTITLVERMTIQMTILLLLPIGATPCREKFSVIICLKTCLNTTSTSSIRHRILYLELSLLC